MTAQTETAATPTPMPSRLPRLFRTPVRHLSAARLFRGGRVGDAGRLPRYLGIFALGAAAIWGPVTSYLATAPLRYTSSMSLILPGSGASASVNLDRIGQASSFANSAFSSPSVSPTETYKRLLAADRILAAAAGDVGMIRRDFGQPRINLIDQTGLIHVELVGNSPEDSQARLDALLNAFFTEIDALRNDELAVREDGGRGALEEYRQSVAATRAEISRLQRETGLITAAQYDDLVDDTEALKTSVAALESDLTEKTQAVATLRATLGIDAPLAAATLRLHADTEFNTIVEEMAQHATALAESRGQFGTNHPTLRAARANHDATRDRAMIRAAVVTGLAEAQVTRLDMSPIGGRAELLSNLVRLDSERAGLEAELGALRMQLSRAQTRIRNLIEPAARLEDLQRDFAVAEAVFASAMARSQTSKVDLFASYPLVQVLENPSLPEQPSSPKRKLAVAAGLAATLFLLMGLTLGWIRQPVIDRLLAKDAGQA